LTYLFSYYSTNACTGDVAEMTL